MYNGTNIKLYMVIFCSGTVTNVLMTWSSDNICRLWSETVLPDDGLVDVQQFDLKVLQDPKLNATRHKNKFVHKLSHIR